jgi:CheY-like chemotaxis protein
MKDRPSPIRILLVDDDAMSLELLSVLLQGEGYAVQSADSGEAALALLGQATSAPDLVLTDVQMPGTTGSKLARELRRVCGPATRLLAMSGSQPTAKTIAHFDGFLLKPFKMQDVAAALLPRSPATKPIDAKATGKKKGKWTVVPGPASPSGSSPKLVPISASAPPKASKKNMDTDGSGSLSPEHIAGSTPPDRVLNEKIYQQLAGSMPPQQLLEMYAMCLNDARERIAGMRVMVAEHDTGQLRREAHSIKGGCGMLGATELHSMAAALETGPTGEEPDVNSLDELSAACDRLERMLRSRV